MQCRFVDLSRKTWEGNFLNIFLQDFTRPCLSICVNSSLSLRCKCCRETRNSRRQQTWICFMKNCVKFFLTWEKRNGENLLWLGRSDAARHERRAIESTVTIVVSMVELVQLDADGKLRFSSSHAEDLFLGLFFSFSAYCAFAKFQCKYNMHRHPIASSVDSVFVTSDNAANFLDFVL